MKTLFKYISSIFFSICLVLFFVVMILFARELRDVPDITQANLQDPLSSEIYDKNLNLIATVGAEKREYVSLEDIPKNITDAVLSTEDTRFYSHLGIDPIRLIKAVLVNIRSNSAQQGASTITQQVVKNSLLTSDKSLQRKIQEAYLSLKLENKYSSKKNSLSSDKNKAISDSEQKLLENENHYKRMSSQIELDAKNYKRAGASDKEVSESLERNKKELSNNYNHHKNRFNQERDDKVKNIEDNLRILEESYPQDINRVKIYYQQERDKYLSETKEQLDKMVREHEQAIEVYRNQYNSGIKAPIRYKIESSDNGKDFYVTIQ